MAPRNVDVRAWRHRVTDIRQGSAAGRLHPVMCVRVGRRPLPRLVWVPFYAGRTTSASRRIAQ